MTAPKTPLARRRRRPIDPRQPDFLTAMEAAGATPPDLDLVEVPAEPAPAAGAYDDDGRIRQSGRSRQDIARTMSELTGAHITDHMLNTWTGASRANQFPLKLLRSLIIACGWTGAHAEEFLVELLSGTGYRVAGSQELRFARLGQVYLAMAWADGECRRLIAETPLFGGKKGRGQQ